MISIRQSVNSLVKVFRNFSSVAVKNDVFDPLQEAALDENCFLLNSQDKIIGQASKRDCHRVLNNNIPLHRAFSVFLFNSKGSLLLQKRSSLKITYPGCYTNTCCSHPVADVLGENEENQALGIKRAAQRRLHYELGIPTEEIDLNNMLYLTRIHYMDIGNGQWGEHEIDYILFLQKDVTLKPNENEVSELCYVSYDEIDSVVSSLDSPLTPWFKLILKHRLKTWWSNLDSLESFVDHENIHKLF